MLHEIENHFVIPANAGIHPHHAVIPAKAGIQCRPALDSRLRGNDGFVQRARSSLTLLALSTLLTACSLAPTYQRPPVDVGTAFKEGSFWKAANPQAASVPDEWWRLFKDPVLDELQTRVLLGNENLKSSLAQLKAAQAAVASSQAALLPTLGVSLGANRSANALASPKGTSYTLSGSLSSWELDLWGRLSSGVSAADARLQASADDLAAARLSIQATLAQTYFSLRSAEAQVRLLTDTQQAYQRSLELTRNRYQGGVASSADVAQAQSQLKSTQAQMIEAASSRAQLEHAIAVLLGLPPSGFALAATGVLPEVPDVPLQLPATLLERRPDIAAAERRVAAANAQIGVARAAFFPALTLSANAGYRGTDLANLIGAPNLFWSIGPSLALAAFDGGARQAAVDTARAGTDQAASAYRQVVLGALQEVEDNLVIAGSLQQELLVQTEALAAARSNLEVTTNQYKAGTVSFLNVATAQAGVLGSENTLLNVRNRRLAAINLLLKNIAGRWDAPG
jgi:NodT family efflux transporter outer membrane factor (OMF) lipoprotein